MSGQAMRSSAGSLLSSRFLRVQSDIAKTRRDEAYDLGFPLVHFIAKSDCRQPVEHAHPGPAAHPGVDRASFSEALRQGAPLAAVLRNMEERVDEGDVWNPHIPALDRQMGVDFAQCSFAVSFMAVHCSFAVLFFTDTQHKSEQTQ